jgi:polysaccharide pyruvyl transferase WcaK-like protein
VIISSGDLHNVGDLALLLQCAYGVRRSLGVKDVKVRQWASPHAEVTTQLGLHAISVLDGKAPVAWSRAGAGSLVMIGGGQMVRDNASLPSLVSLAALMGWARLTGGRSAIVGCGVDQLRSSTRRQVWRRMFQGASLVTVRDEGSLAEVKALASDLTAPILTTDLAFTPSPLHDDLRRSGGEPKLIIAPCSDPSEHRGVDVEALCRLALQACDTLGLEHVALLAHDARPGMDKEICERIKAALIAARPGLHVSLTASHTLSDFTRLYASAALVLTNRLHAVIFSLIAGRPIVILDDGTPKLRAAAETFSIPLTPVAACAAESIFCAAVDAQPAQALAVLRAKSRALDNFDLLAASLAVQR